MYLPISKVLLCISGLHSPSCLSLLLRLFRYVKNLNHLIHLIITHLSEIPIKQKIVWKIKTGKELMCTEHLQCI